MTGVPIYRTAVEAEWIDYNGHMRDAYYGLILSHATDAVMDLLGIDAAYRERTFCTLYTIEMHIHYLHEVNREDVVSATVRIIGADHKRIHAELDLWCARHAEAVATAEIMLLHLRQGAKPAAQSFPSEITRAVESLQARTAAMKSAGPGSRRMELRSRPRE